MRWVRTFLVLSIFVSAVGGCSWAQWKHSGPITISGQNGVVIKNMSITSVTGNCITVKHSKNITVESSQIGPCGTAGGSTLGNGIQISDSSGVHIYDNYIHPETHTSTCCDYHDGIYGSGGNRDVVIQGNVIAYGESNIEFDHRNSSITVKGNFLLNPRGPFPRGQNFQCWGNRSDTPCSGITVENNYALSSQSTSRYRYAADQEDSINFGFTDGAVARDNYIEGGRSPSGCGLIADEAANNIKFVANKLLNTGQCGIGIADGTNQLVDRNEVYNSTPVPKGGNTAIYTWKQYRYKCGPTTVSNNVADEIRSGGVHSGFFDGGHCGTTLSGNTFGAAADQRLTPTDTVFPKPLIPPQPVHCIASSPYTTSTQSKSGKPDCRGGR